MKWQYLSPKRVDLLAHLNFLKPAFDGSDSPKQEFEQVRDWVLSGEVGFYMVSMKGVALRFVGRVIGDAYHIVAMTGRGVVEASTHIIERVKRQGYQTITFHTYRKGMRRILRSTGFEQVKQVREFDGACETVHQLTLTGVSNG